MNEIDVINNFDKAMRNSYAIIMKHKTFDELVEDNQVFFAHDVEDNLKEKDLDAIIEYFAGIDEFEKCIGLKKVKDNIDNDDSKL